MAPPMQETVVSENVSECALGEFKLLVDTNTGYFNATKMCKQQGKQYSRYESLVKSKSLEKLCVSLYGNSCSSYIITASTTNAPEAGTYCHPIIFLSVAWWCSNKLYVTSATIVSDFFNRNEGRRAQFTHLLETKGVPILQKVVEFELAVDTNRWLAIIFCIQNGKKITNFEHFEHKHDGLITDLIHCLTHAYGHTVTKYSNILLASDSGHHKHYHPILFLRLAALVSDEFYVKTLRIAFSSLSGLVDDAQLKQMLIYKSEVDSTPIALSIVAVDYTVDTLSNTVMETAIEFDTKVENDDEVVSEDDVSGQHQIELQPTHSRTVPENTSTGGAYIGEVWCSNEDDSTNDSYSKFDDEEKCVKFFTESDMDRIRTQHKIEMDKLKYEMNVQKQRLERKLRDDRNEFEREKKAIEENIESRVQQIESVKKLEQEYLEKRLLREKEDVERKLLHDKEVNERKLVFEFNIKTRNAIKERESLRLKLKAEQEDRENEVEMLRQQIEALRVGHSEDDTVSRKRRRVNCVLNMSEQQGISKLESVIVIRLSNGDICTFRRQLKSLANVLHKHRHEIQAFECWFLTDNAVQDYNYCKKTLSDNMNCVTFKNNHIKTSGSNIDIVAQTLYQHLKSMGTIEADVSVLKRFYEEDASAVNATSHLIDNSNSNDPTQVLLGQVYHIVTNLYNELVNKEKK